MHVKKGIALIIFYQSLIQISSGCSVTPDFNFPTIEEQTDLASAMIRGKVSKVTGDINRGSIELDVLEYVKGCGHKGTVAVTGFTNSAMCGVGRPKIGDEVMVFVCAENSSRTKWSLNKYTLFTGMYYLSSDFIKEDEKRRAKVEELRTRVRKRYGCTACCKSFLNKCGKREDDNGNTGGEGPGPLPPTGGNPDPPTKVPEVFPTDPDDEWPFVQFPRPWKHPRFKHFKNLPNFKKMNKKIRKRIRKMIQNANNH